MSKAVEYSRKAIRCKSTPKYVKKQMKVFLKDYDGKNKKYFVLYTADKYETTDDYEVVFQNEAGVILRKVNFTESK